MLFLVYINDLTLETDKCFYTIYNYADDSSLAYTKTDTGNVQHIFNNELYIIFQTGSVNNLQRKNFCIFHNNSRNVCTVENISLVIDSISISKVNVVNFLGLLVDNNMKWDDHISSIKSKVSKCIGIMYKLKFYVPQSVLFTLYNALILPYLSYCISVWGNCGISIMDTILKLQKKAIRICSFVS